MYNIFLYCLLTLKVYNLPSISKNLNLLSTLFLTSPPSLSLSSLLSYIKTFGRFSLLFVYSCSNFLFNFFFFFFPFSAVLLKLKVICLPSTPPLHLDSFSSCLSFLQQLFSLFFHFPYFSLSLALLFSLNHHKLKMPPITARNGLSNISGTFSPYIKKEQQALQNPPAKVQNFVLLLNTNIF